MAKGAAPSQDQLLELMKRAAEELKHAQEEARTAVLALQKEQAAHQKTEAELEQAQKQVKNAKGQQSADEQLLKDQIDAERENGKALATRVKELEASLDGAMAERESMKAKVAEAETAISVAAQQDEAKHQKLVEAHEAELQKRTEEHEAALQKLVEEHEAALQKLTEEHEKTIAALKEVHEKAQAEAQKAVAEAESHHKGLLDDAAGNIVQIEQQLTHEKEKHQVMAQKLIETRGKVRELEAAVAAEQERVKGLEAAAKQLADHHEKTLREVSDAHTKATADLQANFVYSQQELAGVTERWREVERQYEALHREMLLTLEQRDEARRQLENEKAERERLSKVLQGQHR